MQDHTTLIYSKNTIRVIVDASGIWLAATDLFNAVRRTCNRRALACMVPEHLKLLSFPAETGTIILTGVSPLGAATLAAGLSPPVDRMMDGFVRKHCNRIAAEYDLPPLELTVLADWTLPVKPRVSHPDYPLWMDMQRNTRGLGLRPPNWDEPALFDQDPSLPPHDPDASLSLAGLGEILQLRR